MGFLPKLSPLLRKHATLMPAQPARKGTTLRPEHPPLPSFDPQLVALLVHITETALCGDRRVLPALWAEADQIDPDGGQIITLFTATSVLIADGCVPGWATDTKALRHTVCAVLNEVAERRVPVFDKALPEDITAALASLASAALRHVGAGARR
jgi:hypothetical protein